MELMLKVNRFGLDINKKGSKAGELKIPECVGFASAVTFTVICLLFCIVFKKVSSDEALYQHISFTLTILATILLGFADDFLDLRWRYKLIFPFLIVLPAIIAYNGSTQIWIPSFL